MPLAAMVLALGGLLALLALSQAPAAEARTFTPAGKVRGDANSTVTMRLVKRRRGRRSASAASERAGASASRTRIVHISTRRDAGIFTMGPRGNGRHRLRRGLVDGVAVSANGRRMVFARSRPTPCGRCPADFFTEVLVAKGNGREQRMIKKFRHAGVESVAISPNGRWIAISLFRGRRRVTSHRRGVEDIDPDFSPGGGSIVFARGVGTRFDLYTVRTSGRNERRAAHAGIGLIDPDWTRRP